MFTDKIIKNVGKKVAMSQEAYAVYLDAAKQLDALCEATGIEWDLITRQCLVDSMRRCVVCGAIAAVVGMAITATILTIKKEKKQ